MLCFSTLQLLGYSQSTGFYYQGVAKEIDGNPVSNKNVSIYISILSTSPDKLFYKESHIIKTDDVGRFSLVVGEGVVQQGKYNEIDWKSKEIWIQTEIEAGNGLEDMGKARILPVPIASRAIIADQVLKAPYDYIAGAGVSSPYIPQGAKTLKISPTISSYMYDHEAVDFSLENSIDGVTINPTNFSYKVGATAPEITMSINKELNPGRYEFSGTTKAESGKVRSFKSAIIIVEDTIGKLFTGKWRVTDTYNGKDTVYIEEIKLVGYNKLQFTNNDLKRNRHALHNNKEMNVSWSFGAQINILNIQGGQGIPSSPMPYFYGADQINIDFSEFKIRCGIHVTQPLGESESHVFTFTRIP